ncbi:MAG: glycosyltransferase [Bacteroidota bacterium]|nr:glycosyltransferase [Bacteroidota bacterium]
MNIIVIGPAYPWRGGIAHHTAVLAKNLEENHQVEVITFKRQYPKLLFPGKNQYDSGKKPADIKTNQLIDSINPFNWISVALKIRKKNTDLVIFAFSIPFMALCYGTIARIIKFNSKAKILFICHNVIPHERMLGDLQLIKYALKSGDYFIVQSKTVENELLKLVPKAKFRSVPHPVYEFFGHLTDKFFARKALNINSKNVILFFGYIRQYKGLMVLLDAMEEIASLKEPPLLLIVGEFYDNEEKYRKYIKNLGIEEYVRIFSNYVPNEIVNIFFSAADLVVLPYISATQSGITQIAYNFDKPVIASDVGGLAEIVIDGKTGYIVPPNNPTKLADAIIKYFDEEREQNFSDNVKIEKRKYSWEHFVETIEDLVK